MTITSADLKFRFRPRKEAIRYLRFDPPLRDPDGRLIARPVPVSAIVYRADPAVVNVSSLAGSVALIPPDRMRHILDRPGALTSAPDIDTGIFFPQYSTAPALQNLADELFAEASPTDIGPSRGGGRFALIAGALALRNTETGQTVPRLVGTIRRSGAPTNLVAMFLTSSNIVWTMYPTGPVVHFHPT